MSSFIDIIHQACGTVNGCFQATRRSGRLRYVRTLSVADRMIGLCRAADAVGRFRVHGRLCLRLSYLPVGK
jgi:hypothetical protein